MRQLKKTVLDRAIAPVFPPSDGRAPALSGPLISGGPPAAIGALHVEPDRLVRLPELMVLTGMSRSAIYAAMDPNGKAFDPDFPPRLALGGRAVAWRFSSVMTFVRTRPIRSASVPIDAKVAS